MVITILPREQGISFEYHLFGAIAGLLSAFAFRHWDPKLKEKTYSWQESSEQDDLIGDEWKSEKTDISDEFPNTDIDNKDSGN